MVVAEQLLVPIQEHGIPQAGEGDNGLGLNGEGLPGGIGYQMSNPQLQYHFLLNHQMNTGNLCSQHTKWNRQTNSLLIQQTRRISQKYHMNSPEFWNRLPLRWFHLSLMSSENSNQLLSQTHHVARRPKRKPFRRMHDRQAMQWDCSKRNKHFQCPETHPRTFQAARLVEPRTAW